MSDSTAETPSFPTAEGGVSASPIEYLWFIAGRFDGMRQGYIEHMMNNLGLEAIKCFPQKSSMFNNVGGYIIFCEGTDEQFRSFLEIYKRTVEIWGADIRFTKQFRVMEVSNP